MYGMQIGKMAKHTRAVQYTASVLAVVVLRGHTTEACRTKRNAPGETLCPCKLRHGSLAQITWHPVPAPAVWDSGPEETRGIIG